MIPKKKGGFFSEYVYSGRWAFKGLYQTVHRKQFFSGKKCFFEISDCSELARSTEFIFGDRTTNIK